MKYLIGTVAMLLAMNAYSQEIVVVEKKGIAYALVTSCTTTSRPTAVRVGKPEKGSTVIMKTRKKTHKCEVKKAVRLT